MFQFFGHKTSAFFDVWSIEHIVSGICCGSFVIWYAKKEKSNLKTIQTQGNDTRFELVCLLCIAFVWEAFEHYLESGIAGDVVQVWLQGVEAWHNRLVSDPLMMVIGYFIVRKYPKVIWTARIFSLTWLVVHIFVFPHSMYLSDVVFRL